MAELGQTGDPRALVPGAPETVEADAAALAGHSRRVEQVGRSLRAVDVAGWGGPAGARFADVWTDEPPKWLKVADAVGLAATTLAGYAATLRWAQSQAAGAIELWNGATAITDRAAADYQGTIADAAADCRWTEPFVDPAESLRREAQELLARARERLREAGDQAARALGGTGIGRLMTLPGAAPTSALDDLVNAVTGSAGTAGSFTAGGLTGAGKAGINGASAGAEASGPEFDLGGGELKLGELRAYAHLFDAGAEGSLRHGDLTAAGTASASYGPEANAAAGIGREGLVANAEASAGLRAAAEVNARYGIVGARAAVNGLAGAVVGAELAFTKDQVEVTGEAFAGGKLGGEAGGDVGGLGAGVRGEVWAGVGVEWAGGCKFEDGKFHLGMHGGAALGLGGSAGFDITVDPEEIGQTAMEAADAIGTGLDDGLDAAGDAVSGLADHFGL